MNSGKGMPAEKARCYSRRLMLLRRDAAHMFDYPATSYEDACEKSEMAAKKI